jgi:hypothetical protein
MMLDWRALGGGAKGGLGVTLFLALWRVGHRLLAASRGASDETGAAPGDSPALDRINATLVQPAMMASASAHVNFSDTPSHRRSVFAIQTASVGRQFAIIGRISVSSGLKLEPGSAAASGAALTLLGCAHTGTAAERASERECDLEQEFIHGTLMIDNDGVVTDTLYCDDRKVKVTVIIPSGALGDYTSFDHTKIWKAYQSVKERIEAIVKERFSGLPTENCTITLEKTDLPTRH